MTSRSASGTSQASRVQTSQGTPASGQDGAAVVAGFSHQTPEHLATEGTSNPDAVVAAVGANAPLSREQASPSWQQTDVTFQRRMRADLNVTMPDGVRVPFWTFEDPLDDAPGRKSESTIAPSPIIRIPLNARAGITLETHRTASASAFPTALRSASSVRSKGAGSVLMESHESYTYHWQPRKPGTWFYHSHTSTAHQFEMGLYGVISVDTPGGDGETGRLLYPGGPTYDAEKFWIFDDVDPDWHQPGFVPSPMPEGRVPPFRPRYFLINGVPNTLAATHPDVSIEAKLGQKLLLRMLNASFSLVSVKVSGLPASIVAVDGNMLGSQDRPWTRAIAIRPDQPLHLATASRYDVLIDLDPLRSGCEKGRDYVVTFEFQNGRTRRIHNPMAREPAHVGRAVAVIRVL